MKSYKKDLKYSVISGLLTGLVVWRLAEFLDIPKIMNVSYAWSLIIVPIIWYIGVNLGYFLGRFFKPFNQFGRFAAVGFTNAAVDFGILNLAIYFTGISSGILYAVFKAASFTAASINSYTFNKYWTFEAGKSDGGTSEFVRFVGVALLAVAVNVTTASIVVNFVDPIGDLGPNEWANVGAVVGAAASLLFSFIGFRRVFKK